MADVHYLSISEIAEKIRSKEISPREVVQAHLHRATELHPRLNAFVHIDEVGALAQAEAAEGAILRGDRLGPLHGVPLTVKSCINVARWQCAAGSLLRKENRPNEDAALVQRLRTAGAILLGTPHTRASLRQHEPVTWLSGKTAN